MEATEMNAEKGSGIYTEGFGELKFLLSISLV